MRPFTVTLLCLSAVVALGCRPSGPGSASDLAAAPVQERAPASAGATPGYAPIGVTPCGPVGPIEFVCDLISAEDFAIVPGARWIIASGNREGGRLHLVSVRDKAATTLFPTAERNERFDAAAYPTCPGPLNLEKPDAFRAHGLYLEPGQGVVHTLYVVHHGTRESIEIFEVDARSTPALTWVGCAPALSTQRFNSVVALPEGGFAATSTTTGDVWEYQSRTGWNRVPGSEGSAPNGLEISPDGRWLYIAGYAEEKLTRLSRGRTPVEKAIVQVGFRPDNLRLSPDGTFLFAAGHTDKDGRSIREPREPLRETSNVAKIDTETLELRRIFQHPAIDGFVTATTAIQIGSEMWLGTQRGERIAYFPAPE